MNIPTWNEYNNGKQFEYDKEELMSLPEYDLDKVEDKGKKEYPEGEYFFEVTDSREKESKAGNVYTSLVLAVEIDDNTIKVFDNVFYSEKALFRIKQIMDSTGIDRPTEHDHFIGAKGKAKFVKGDNGYLEVKWYISQVEAGVSVKEVKDTFTAPVEPKDIPF